jgi:3-hydroxyacyl-CoA dehydrogenase
MILAIEILASPQTEISIVPLLMEQCSLHGFKPFQVKQESNGYIYNRIWAAIKREALLVASEGVASPAEIDGIYKEVLKTPKGPFEQMDIVGLDVVFDIEKSYAEKRKGLPEEPRKLLSDMVSRGMLGVKSGEGFYKYKNANGDMREKL